MSCPHSDPPRKRSCILRAAVPRFLYCVPFSSLRAPRRSRPMHSTDTPSPHADYCHRFRPGAPKQPGQIIPRDFSSDTSPILVHFFFLSPPRLQVGCFQSLVSGLFYLIEKLKNKKGGKPTGKQCHDINYDEQESL